MLLHQHRHTVFTHCQAKWKIIFQLNCENCRFDRCIHNVLDLFILFFVCVHRRHFGSVYLSHVVAEPIIMMFTYNSNAMITNVMCMYGMELELQPVGVYNNKNNIYTHVVKILFCPINCEARRFYSTDDFITVCTRKIPFLRLLMPFIYCIYSFFN